MSWPTALGIPCPWDGAHVEEADWRYALWFRLYRTVRVVEHLLGRHEWHTYYPSGGPVAGHTRCQWCGARREAPR